MGLDIQFDIRNVQAKQYVHDAITYSNLLLVITQRFYIKVTHTADGLLTFGNWGIVPISHLQQNIIILH